jgi:hypothetical protein
VDGCDETEGLCRTRRHLVDEAGGRRPPRPEDLQRCAVLHDGDPRHAQELLELGTDLEQLPHGGLARLDLGEELGVAGLDLLDVELGPGQVLLAARAGGLEPGQLHPQELGLRDDRRVGRRRRVALGLRVLELVPQAAQGRDVTGRLRPRGDERRVRRRRLARGRVARSLGRRELRPASLEVRGAGDRVCSGRNGLLAHVGDGDGRLGAGHLGTGEVCLDTRALMSEQLGRGRGRGLPLAECGDVGRLPHVHGLGLGHRDLEAADRVPARDAGRGCGCLPPAELLGRRLV